MYCSSALLNSQGAEGELEAVINENRFFFFHFPGWQKYGQTQNAQKVWEKSVNSTACCEILASGRVCMPASLILLAYSQSYKTMRNKSALSKNKEVCKRMALPDSSLEH